MRVNYEQYGSEVDVGADVIAIQRGTGTASGPALTARAGIPSRVGGCPRKRFDTLWLD